MSERLMVIDGNSLMHRAFYALPDMATRAGVHTNAVLGFVNMLIKAADDFSPTHLAVAFDRPEPTFRHKRYGAYKAGRREMPETLLPQFAILRDLLCAMGVTVLDAPGYEADDILGTLSHAARERGMDALLVTGDRDALQLIGGGVTVLLTRKGLSQIDALDAGALKSAFGVTPEQIIDLKGLMGDASDNLPGVPGVGEKTALKLLESYGTLDAVLAHASEIKGKLGEKLAAHADDAMMCRELATIVPDVPIERSIESMRLGGFGTPEALEMLLSLEMNSVRNRLLPSEDKITSAPQGSSPRNARTVTDEEELIAWLDARNVPPVAIALTREVFSVAFESGESVDAPVGGDLLNPGIGCETAMSALHRLVRRFPECRLTVFDKKTFLQRLTRAGFAFPSENIGYDVMLAAYLLDVSDASSMQAASKRWLGEEREDADALVGLHRSTREGLRAEGMEKLFGEMEMPLSDVLMDMEDAGFLIDKAELSRIGDELREASERLRAEIVGLAGGYDFNPNSTKQLAEVLFDRMGLPVVKKNASGRSTDSEVLEKLEESHPIASKVLEYRHIVKLLGTYIDGLSAVAGPDGRVHTTFNQALTSTGRISSSEPNLQNIPVRTELGRTIRRAFIAPPGWMLLDADYSQIELRVLAHVSGDPAFIDAFISGQDIHSRTASEVFGVQLGEVSPAQRSAAKAVNFGIVYGISDFGLAKNIGCSRSEAADIIKRFFQRYPSVKHTMDGFIQKAREDGYAETLFGRRRRIPDIHSKNFNRRSFGERAAMNMPIQGASADIIKLAMIEAPRVLRAGGWRSRLILQVHDELIIEAPESEAGPVSALLKKAMESVVRMSVPLVADVGVGKNWAESKA